MGRKRAAFKGTWYPAKAGECESHIKAYLEENKGILKGNYKGCIVPHAGWYFSGSIAGRTIASLAGADKKNGSVDAVAVFGMHMGPGTPSLILKSGSFETPFGDIDIHEELTRCIVEKASAVGADILERDSLSFPEENTIELQLPFIKYFFQDTPVVLIGVPPDDSAAKLGRAVFDASESLGIQIAAVGSTDLTHYGPSYGFSSAGTGEKAFAWVKDVNDAGAVKALISMDAEKIIKEGRSKQNMCCPGAAAAAATVSGLSGAAKGIEVEYSSSYDKSPGDSFVGYTGILFSL